MFSEYLAVTFKGARLIKLVLNCIYVLYPYIRFEKSPKIPLTDFAAFFNVLLFVHILKLMILITNVLELYMIPLIYLPSNKPNILLQRPIKNLKMDDCWLMKGSKVYVEIEFVESVEVDHFDYYPFNQTVLSDSTPKVVTVETITNNDTLLNLGTFNAFDNVTHEHDTHTVISRLKLHILQNHGNPVFTSLCRFQLFGEEEKEASARTNFFAAPDTYVEFIVKFNFAIYLFFVNF